MKQFKVREGFEIELMASEPAMTQPLFATWDSRGRMWVVQDRQCQFPAGLKIVRYDQHLRRLRQGAGAAAAWAKGRPQDHCVRNTVDGFFECSHTGLSFGFWLEPANRVTVLVGNDEGSVCRRVTHVFVTKLEIGRMGAARRF